MAPPRPSRGIVRLAFPSPVVAVVLPLAYLATAVLAIQLTRSSGNIASLWPSTAILLVALVRHEPPAWPVLALLAAAADLASGLVLGSAPWRVVGFTAANVGEALLAAAALRRLGEPGT